MQTLSQRYTESDHHAVNTAIRAVESRTIAEVVPVIVTSSGRYDRSEDVVGLWMGLGCLAIAWRLYPVPVTSPGTWGGPHPIWQLVVMVLAVLAGFICGTVLASRIDWLRRLCTPWQEMSDEVLSRAQTVFYDQRVHHTPQATGILLYVSLFEHIAVVLADQVTLEKLGQEKIDEICEQFTRRLHQKPTISALCETIESMGETLSQLLPRTGEAGNALPDGLILID